MWEHISQNTISRQKDYGFYGLAFGSEPSKLFGLSYRLQVIAWISVHVSYVWGQFKGLNAIRNEWSVETTHTYKENKNQLTHTQISSTAIYSTQSRKLINENSINVNWLNTKTCVYICIVMWSDWIMLCWLCHFTFIHFTFIFSSAFGFYFGLKIYTLSISDLI